MLYARQAVRDLREVPAPQLLLALEVEGAVSVDIMSTSPAFIPPQSAALSASERMGGEQTNFAPSKSGFS